MYGDFSERQFSESLDALLEMTSVEDDTANSRRTSPLSESLLSAATSAVLGEQGVAAIGAEPQSLNVCDTRMDSARLVPPLTAAAATGPPMKSETVVPRQGDAPASISNLLPIPSTSIVAPHSVLSSFSFAIPNTTRNPGIHPPKRPAPTLCSEDDEEFAKRRQDRNAREQQRAQQITQQISQLRTLLQSLKLEFKPDKFTTLYTATQYIQKLQQTSATLAAEHKKLLATVQQTTEQLHHPPTEVKDTIPYRGIFYACPTALCVTNLDGRFLDANPRFLQLNGLNDAQKDLIDQRKSIFNLLHRSDIESVFCAMSQLLAYSEDNKSENTNNDADHFAQNVLLGGKVEETKANVQSSRRVSQLFVSVLPPVALTSCLICAHQISLRVCLIRSDSGFPRYFQCLMLPCDEGETATAPGGSLQTTG